MGTKNVLFHFDVVKLSDGSSVIAVSRVRDLDEDVRYSFDNKHKLILHHKFMELFKKLSEVPIIKSGLKDFSTLRNLKITLEGKLFDEYCDKAGNFVFRGDYLNKILEDDAVQVRSAAVSH